MRTFILFLMLGLLAACGREAGQDAGSRHAAEAGPTTAYTRRMIFVGGTDSTPAIIAFEHLVLANPAAVERRAAFWRATGEGWEPLLDQRWSDEPIREPWRLIPQGPFRFRVDDAGDLEALIIRDGEERLELSPLGRLGLWSPEESPFFRIQLGELKVGADSTTGVLLDLQPGAENEESGASVMELVLTDGTAIDLVARSTDGRPADLWLRRHGRSETMAGIEIARTDSAGVERWDLISPLGEVIGRLEAVGAPLELRYDEFVEEVQSHRPQTRMGARGPGEDAMAVKEMPTSTTLQMVRGSIDLRGDRGSVFGVMRRRPA